MTRIRISLAILVGALPIYLWMSLTRGIEAGWSPWLIAVGAVIIVAIVAAVYRFLPEPSWWGGP